MIDDSVREVLAALGVSVDEKWHILSHSLENEVSLGAEVSDVYGNSNQEVNVDSRTLTIRLYTREV